jgi:Domain of unknown function (DUF4136)
MRIFRACIFFAFILLFPAILSAQKVTTDFDHSVNFSQYKTFMWLREPRMRDPLMKRRVIDAINKQLTAKGWQLVTEGADVGIIANGATTEEHTLETFYTGFGGWGWRGWGSGIATTIPEYYTIGTLIVDLFDTRTKQVIWRGTATGTLPDKPEKTAQKLNKAIEKMFKKFPPMA